MEDQLPIYEGSIEETFVLEHPENIVHGWYYILDNDPERSEEIIEYQYIGRVIMISSEDIGVIATWKREIIMGNIHPWINIESDDLTFELDDLRASDGEEPYVRFYRPILQS